MRRSLALSATLVFSAVVACGDNLHRELVPDASPDATPDAPQCVPLPDRPQLESLTSGDLVIDETQASNVAPITSALDRSILFVSLRENEGSPNYGGVLCYLQDADTVAGTPEEVVCKHNRAGTDTTGGGVIHVRWTVATFASGVMVQRGLVNTGITNPSVVTLATPADLSSTFVLLGGMLNSGSGWGNNEFVRATLLDPMTLEVRTTVPGTQTAWQTVTMIGASVQRGSTSFSMTDKTGQVPINIRPGSMVLASYNTDNPSGIAAAALMLKAVPTADGITFEREADGSNLAIDWQVVALPFFSRAMTTDLAAGEASKTEAVAGLPAASSVAIASNQAIFGQSAGSTDYAGTDVDLLGEAAASLTVTDGGVTLERTASSSNASISWTVIDFAHDRCSNL